MSDTRDTAGTKVVLSARWRLASLTEAEWRGVAMAAAIAAFIFVLFHFMGNTVSTVASRSAFVWMRVRWADKISYGGADYSHGWLIPFVSLFVVWLRRKDIIAAPKAVDRRGLILIVAALLLHWVGAKMQQTRVSLTALILLLWGFPFYFFGWGVARHLVFPAAYLAFCIPLTFLDVIAFPLRLLATNVSAATLNGLGLDVVQEGPKILAVSPMGGTRWGVDVENPCSGLRSLLAMTALTAIYAYLTQRTLWKKWALFILSIPLAIAGNVARIIFIGLMAEAFGEKVAVGIVHDYSGYVVFSVAILLMVGIGSLMNANVRNVWRDMRDQMLRPA
jgi:exosortase